MENISDYNIVTNNPSVKNEYENIIFVEGSYKDVLFKVRDFVYNGGKLISHPLGASIRMFYSPYRSIIIRKKSEGNNEFHIKTIDNSIQNYIKQMKSREPDLKNSEDYSFTDKSLLNSALDEFKRMGNFK